MLVEEAEIHYITYLLVVERIPLKVAACQITSSLTHPVLQYTAVSMYC